MITSIRRATKICQDEETGEIRSNQCAFHWKDVVGMEDDAATDWPCPKPRTLIWAGLAEFYIIGEYKHVLAEWLAYLDTAASAHSIIRSN